MLRGSVGHADGLGKEFDTMTRFSSPIMAMSVLVPALLLSVAGCATTHKSQAATTAPGDAIADATVLVHGVT